jgi:hypothetical protein
MKLEPIPKSDRRWLFRASILRAERQNRGTEDKCPRSSTSSVWRELVLAIKLATPLETLADVIHPFPAFNRVLGQVLEGLAAKVARQGDRHEQYTVER